MKLLFENWRGYLNEIGEGSLKPYPYRLAPRTSDGEIVLYEFKTEGDFYYSVVFKQDESTSGVDYWDISFTTEEVEMGETGEGQPLKIMSTVLKIIKDFISKPDLNKNIRTYAFAGSPKRGEIIDPAKPSSRTKLYTRFLKKNMPDGTQIKDRGNAIWFILPEPPKQPDEPIDPEYLNQLGDLFERKEPAKGTGKKPKGSGRRLYTDENPKDTVSVKFSTVQDIRDTLSKASFKSKSHKRQSQIINLIHQRVRAAYQNAKDPKVKARLKKAYDYAKKRKEASKEKTKRMNREK